MIKSYQRNLLVTNKRATNNPIAPSLLKKLGGESIGTKDSIMWGQMHEGIAIKKYTEETGNAVNQLGLCYFPVDFLKAVKMALSLKMVLKVV